MTHPPPSSTGRSNRLRAETSPYLLQHAANPVDWFPWGQEAFDEARRRQVPIFLSVGYSTCYWCHVMERESFEDPRIGDLLRDGFVAVKVDREERPEVDEIYMGAVQAMTGRGGWPMSVFLSPPGARGEADPGLEPFYAGTYFPPKAAHQLPSFAQVLTGVSAAWSQQREQVLAQAGAVTAHLRDAMSGRRDPVRLGQPQIVDAATGLLRTFDSTHGGFGHAPKFPQPVYLEFVFDALAAAGDDSTVEAFRVVLTRTLDAMALGGMFDQAGGGFHRYSVDERWLVPHFEKMLYDNAQLLALYARAAAALDDDFFALIARRVAGYVAQEMTSPEGLFYSAQDAEVDGREGANYVWSEEEVRAAVGDQDADFAAEIYGLTRGPNFRDPHHPGAPAKNVPFLIARPDALASKQNVAPDDLHLRLDRVNAALLRTRAQRQQPRLDDKVIASWNGMMIGALADASRHLEEPAWLDRAERAGEAAWTLLRDQEGLLCRVRRGGENSGSGGLEDYAWLAWGFAAIARASKDRERWIDRAAVTLRQAQTLFADERDGALYDTRAGRPDLIVRSRSIFDGSLPSAPSVALHAMLDLHELSKDDSWLESAGRLLATLSAAVAESPVGAINTTRALLRVLRIDGGLIERSGMLNEPETSDAPTSEAESPVEILSEADRVTVPPEKGAGASVRLRLRVKDGFHITAHDPWPREVAAKDRIPEVVPLIVRLAPGSGDAVRLEVDYPDGRLLEPADGDEDGSLPPLLVHEEEVELPLRLVRTDAAWSGRPLILVSWQACTRTECLRPTTVELDIAIDPG